MYFDKGNKPFDRSSMEIIGGLLFRVNDQNFLKNTTVKLLENLDKYGSITKAAKQMNISYKTAWDMLNAINNITKLPMVESISGGTGGGGSRLTEHGRKMVEVFRIIEDEQQKFISNLKLKIDNFDETFQLMKRMFLKTSVRNQLTSHVIRINQGQVGAEVELSIQGDDKITSFITNKSLTDLDIHIGSEVYAMIKATYVMISPSNSIENVDTNIFKAKILDLSHDDKKVEIKMLLEGGNTLVAMEPIDVVSKHNFKVGDTVYTFFKPSSVILGVS